jgi:hypothetical protein
VTILNLKNFNFGKEALMMNFLQLLWPKGLDGDLYVLPKLRERSTGTDLFSFDLVFDLVFMGALEKLSEIPGYFYLTT